MWIEDHVMTNPQTFPRKAADFHKIQHQKKFLAAFAACGSILPASRSAQIDRGSHYSWMRTDPTYPERFRQAEIEAARALEDEAVRRARAGIRRPVLHKGKQVYVPGEPLFTTEYSDSLLMFLLKANNPDKFRDRIEQVNTQDIDIDRLSPEILDKLADHLIQKVLKENSLRSDAQAVAEVGRRLEAGETVTVEALAEEQTEEPGK